MVGLWVDEMVDQRVKKTVGTLDSWAGYWVVL